jgi:hypothetical protein
MCMNLIINQNDVAKLSGSLLQGLLGAGVGVPPVLLKIDCYQVFFVVNNGSDV